MFIKVKKKELFSISGNKNISAIEILKEGKVVTGVPGFEPRRFEELIFQGYNPSSAMINYGGSSVATLEIGLRSSFVNCIPSWLRPTSYREPTSSYSNSGWQGHSEGTFYITSFGTPGNNRYHFDSWTFKDSGIVDSIQKYSVKSISTSHYNPWEIADYANIEARTIDRFPYTYPYPVVVFPTGNLGDAYIPDPHMFNILLVGNVQKYDDLSYSSNHYLYNTASGGVALSDAQQSRNPVAKYGSSRDNEQPNIVAPGTTPDPWWGFINECIFLSDNVTPWGPTSGTSFSAPVVNAMATNLIAAGLEGWPEAVRAILLLTAENVDGGYWNSLNDERDGAGTVSGTNAVEFYNRSIYRNAGDAGVTDGINYGTIYETSFNNSKSFNLLTPSTLPSGKHLRVVLTWDSSPGFNANENELSDLDLVVQTNSGDQYSNRWNSNTEMVDISNSMLTPNTNYNITISPWLFRKSTDGPDYFYYSIAWTWVKDHAD